MKVPPLPDKVSNFIASLATAIICLTIVMIILSFIGVDKDLRFVSAVLTGAIVFGFTDLLYEIRDMHREAMHDD